MPGIWIVTLSSAVFATGPTCSRRTPTFRYSVDLDEGSFEVQCCVASSAFNKSKAPNQLLQMHWRVLFAGEVGGVTYESVLLIDIFFNHGLSVPCASVRKHKNDKFPVVAPRTQFESLVSRYSSKDQENCPRLVLPSHPIGWYRFAQLAKVQWWCHPSPPKKKKKYGAAGFVNKAVDML